MLVGGRKVAGILAEAREGRVVLGIGVNVNVAADELPTEVDRRRPRSLVETAASSTAPSCSPSSSSGSSARYDAWLGYGYVNRPARLPAASRDDGDAAYEIGPR